MVYFLSLVLVSGLFSYPQKTSADSEAEQSPLLLQYQVSHPRNVDQISLLFREKIQLVTNVFTSESRPVRLGWFELAMDPELQQQIQTHYDGLQARVRRISDPPGQPHTTIVHRDDQTTATHIHPPHETIIRINDEVTYSGLDMEFHPLLQIIRHVWEREWKCVECATYTKDGNAIVRVVKKPSNKQGVTTIFLRKELNCYPTDSDQWECVDPEWGIFEL